MWLWFHTIPDEIGPMELKSKEFVDVVENLLSTAEKVIVVLHQNLEHTLTDKFRKKIQYFDQHRSGKQGRAYLNIAL